MTNFCCNRFYLCMFALLALFGLTVCSAKSSSNSVGPSVELIDRSSSGLVTGDLTYVKGTYSSCTARLDGQKWSVAIGSSTKLEDELSVVKNDDTCKLVLTSLQTTGMFSADPAILLGTAYANNASKFGSPVQFYANAKLSTATFSSAFTLTILVSDNLGTASGNKNPSYATVSTTSVTASGVPSPDYTVDMTNLTLLVDAHNLVTTATGTVDLTPVSQTGQWYVVTGTSTPLSTPPSYAEVDTAYLAAAHYTINAPTIAAWKLGMVGEDLSAPGVKRTIVIANVLHDVRAYEVIAMTFSGQCGLPCTHGTFTPTGSMTEPRFNPTAELLADGRVLVIAGIDSVGTPLATADLYDPATGTFTATGPMTTDRYYSTATLLPDGKVLVAGGYSGTTISSAEVYDPTTGISTPTGKMAVPRYINTATRLLDGTVLIAGGCNEQYTHPSAELYKPTMRTFTTVPGSLVTPRSMHTATLLPSGKVLLSGGHICGWDYSSPSTYLSTAELYDPATGTFSATGAMSVARAETATALLANGKVLFAGGHTGASTVSIAELYDPATGLLTVTGALTENRYGGRAVLLQTGKVLVVGGYNGTSYLASAELYDPIAGTFAATGAMSVTRLSTQAIRLPKPNPS